MSTSFSRRTNRASVLLALATSASGCSKLASEIAQARPSAQSASPVARPKSDVIASIIYDGALKNGWQDWGWGNHDLGHGEARIDFSNYGGWILWTPSPPSPPGGLEGLVFRMAAPSSFGSFLQVRLAFQKSDAAFPAIDVGPERLKKIPGGDWVEVYLAWSELDPSGVPADQITLHAKTAVASQVVRFDKVFLTSPDPKAKPPPPARTDHVKLSVDCRAPGRPISPYIYGIAGSGEAWELGPTASRWGGNRTTRYNYRLAATNVGKDWFFENTKEADYRPYLNDLRTHQSFGALTLPIIGWVAKDGASVGFPVSKLGPQHATDQYRPDAGDGLDKNNKPIKPGPPSQTSTPADPTFIRQWVEAIVADDKEHAGRSVRMYILDNEPNLWSTNHRDVHPDGLTYDELLDRTLRYGAQVRAADPQALIAGPAEWGWSGYFYSARDLEASATLRPDRRAHGDVPLVPWYLSKLHEHDAAAGTRTLDVLDVHFYPQGAGVYGANADAATAALRIRSTRALWDPNYKDESWINDTVRLIPRMKEWIRQNYPDLKLSIGEYSFGGEQHVSGALAEAEALGRFGTEGVDYAFYWTAPPKNSASFWAFRAYRNFDGHGGHFLEQSLTTKSGSSVSLFASRDAAGKHLVLIALNLDPAVAVAPSLELDGCGELASTRRFIYTQRSQALIAADAPAGKPLDGVLEPYSITVYDVKLK